MSAPRREAPGIGLDAVSLDRAPFGVALVVGAVEPAHAASLAAEGLVPGVTLELESAVPLRGPLVVRLGRARVALARSVAATVRVEQAPAPPGEQPG
jgi:Fe2+ transport system protein FeoA